MDTDKNNFASLLLVEDERFSLALLESCVQAIGYSYVTAKNGKEALKQLESNAVDVIITDMVMPEMGGMELIQRVKKNYPQIDIIVQTAQTKEYTYTDVITAGATDFIEKPFTKDELSAKLSRVFRERQNIKALQELNKVKSDFLNTMSHEFLTPMNGILGFTHLLQETDLSSGQRQYLDLVIESSDRLMLLVNQLLYFSEIKNCDKKLNITLFNLAQLLQEILPPFMSSVRKKDLDLTYAIDGSVPENLHGDRDVFLQVMNNLIDNAVKYTDKGMIEINFGVENKHANDTLLLHCAIKDTGRGLPLEKQQTIFEAFTQGDDYSTRSQDGAGLGLAICQKLVEFMGGSIWVESELNKGSTFHFTAQFGL